MPTHHQSAYSPYPSPYGQRANKRGGRRPKEEEEEYMDLTPEEADKRKLRRIRNKEAAARCRQRRLDHMSELQLQVDKLQSELSQKEDDIDNLKREKAELEYMLSNHACKMTNGFVPKKIRQMVVSQQPIEVRNLKAVEPTLTMVANSKAKDLLIRPDTLNIAGLTTPGVPAETPTSGLTFDLLGASTGLTPVSNTGLTPILALGNSMISSSGTILTLETPTATDVKVSLCQL